MGKLFGTPLKQLTSDVQKVSKQGIENVHGKYKFTILKQFTLVSVRILLSFIIITFF